MCCTGVIPLDLALVAQATMPPEPPQPPRRVLTDDGFVACWVCQEAADPGCLINIAIPACYVPTCARCKEEFDAPRD